MTYRFRIPGRDLLVQLIVATLAPFAPLVLTMIPFEKLLDRRIQSMFCDAVPRNDEGAAWK